MAKPAVPAPGPQPGKKMTFGAATAALIMALVAALGQNDSAHDRIPVIPELDPQLPRDRFEVAGIEGDRRRVAGRLVDGGGRRITLGDAYDLTHLAADGVIKAALATTSEEALGAVCADALQAP